MPPNENKDQNAGNAKCPHCSRKAPIGCTYCSKHCIELTDGRCCKAKTHIVRREENALLEMYREHKSQGKQKKLKGGNDSFDHFAETNFMRRGETITIFCLRTFVLCGAADDALDRERRRLRVRGQNKGRRPVARGLRRRDELRSKGKLAWRRKQEELLQRLGNF